MRPLQSVGMGLVIILIRAPVGDGYDALPDPIGWVLVLVGSVPSPPTGRAGASYSELAWLAAAVSVGLWFPVVPDALADTHSSLTWAANLPQLGFATLLSLTLGRRAAQAGEAPAAHWLRLAAAGFVAAAILPVLDVGGGVSGADIASVVTAALTLIFLIALLFRYSGRPWARPGPGLPTVNGRFPRSFRHGK